MAVAIGTSPETIASVFCSRAEVHDVLQAASWLQQLGYRGHSQPLEGAVVGLVQESSRKLGLQRMRLLLVRHSSPTTDDDGRCCLAGQSLVLQGQSLRRSACSYKVSMYSRATSPSLAVPAVAAAQQNCIDHQSRATAAYAWLHACRSLAGQQHAAHLLRLCCCQSGGGRHTGGPGEAVAARHQRHR